VAGANPSSLVLMSIRNVLLTLVVVLASSPAAAQEPAPPAAAEAGRVYEMTEVERLPSPFNVPDLQAALQSLYPLPQLQTRTSGTVTVAFVVGVDGEVGQASVVSSTDSAFDALSLAAVEVLRFTPATVAGAPVAARVALPIQWQAPPMAGDVEEGTGERVYQEREVDEKPRPLNIADFRYAVERALPTVLTDFRIDGTVEIRFRVDREGVPRDIHVVYGTHAILTQPTLRTATMLRFAPARLNGQAVQMWMQLPIQWRVSPRSQ
jgi:TonB family protein